MAELLGWQESLASLGIESNCLAFFHPLTGCDKTSSILEGHAFQLKTGYFVKMDSLSERPSTDYFAPLDNFSQYCMVEPSKHIYEHRHD